MLRVCLHQSETGSDGDTQTAVSFMSLILILPMTGGSQITNLLPVSGLRSEKPAILIWQPHSGIVCSLKNVAGQ